MSSLVSLLQSSGPISLDELTLRSSETMGELIQQVEALRKEGFVVVNGPKTDLSNLTSEEASQTMIELSSRSLHRLFAS